MAIARASPATTITTTTMTTTTIAFNYFEYFYYFLPPLYFQLVCFLCTTPLVRLFALSIFMLIHGTLSCCFVCVQNHHAYLRAMKYTQTFLSFISISTPYTLLQKHCIFPSLPYFPPLFLSLSLFFCFGFCKVRRSFQKKSFSNILKAF